MSIRPFPCASLARAGFVTLVIDDANGQRVRNSRQQEPFPAGDNCRVVDGSNDLGRDRTQRARVITSPRNSCPGALHPYASRASSAEVRNEMSVYSAGQPAWETADKTAADDQSHAATSALFVPALARRRGSRASISAQSFRKAATACNGHPPTARSSAGQGWVGNGIWTSAPTLACDLGPNADKNFICYVGAHARWRTAHHRKDAEDEDSRSSR